MFHRRPRRECSFARSIALFSLALAALWLYLTVVEWIVPGTPPYF